MASVMNVKESKSFCDEVYNELAGMQKKILELKERAGGKAAGKDIDGGLFGRHLAELADDIEWKLQILAHSCPYDWKGSTEYENAVQVAGTRDEFSPGYIGG